MSSPFQSAFMAKNPILKTDDFYKEFKALESLKDKTDDDIAIVVSDKKLLNTGDLVPSGRAAQQIDEDFPPAMRPKDYEEQNRKTVKHQLKKEKGYQYKNY